MATKQFKDYTIALVIDCKHWGIRKGKKSALKKAALKQEERAKQLKKASPIFPGRLETFPLIVTLMEEDIKRVENIWIVPIFKFNSSFKPRRIHKYLKPRHHTILYCKIVTKIFLIVIY